MPIGSATSLPAAIPFNLARAYGLNGAAAVAKVAPAAAITPAQSTRPLGRIGAPERAAATDRSDAIDRLIGAIVPGKIDFTESAPRQQTGALPFYTRPGDLNTAATNIRLGSSLDIEG